LVSLAAAICVKVGYTFDKKRKKLKNRGYRAKSVFREGLDIVSKTLLKERLQDETTFEKRRVSFLADD
jgi:hypothetical protein